ncbi:hypothetical protein D9M72_574130 [compost metagenome]
MLAFRRSHAALHDGDMSFLESNRDLLAFTREKDGERLLFVFNLTREPQEFLVSDALVETVPLPGQSAEVVGGVLKLDGLSAYCGKL